MKIKKWKSYEKNSLKGFLSLELPSGLILHGFTYHMKEDSTRWVGMPSKEHNGEYFNQIEFSSKEVKDTFQSEALAALDRYFDGRSR